MADHTKIEWTEATWNPVTGCTVTSPGCTNCYAMRLAGTRLRDHPSRAGLTQPTRAGPVWNGEVRFNEEWLTQPLRWKRPRMIFVCAHGDLFHESVPDEWIDRVFAVMALCPQHTFQVLTKRSKRMREYMTKVWGDHDAEIARTTAAVNYVFRIAGQRGNWGYCGSTSTAITTIGSGTGAREYAMLRRRPDGGVERFYWVDGKETWYRCSDAYAARVPVWVAHTSEFSWGLKQWPLPNVWLGVSVEDQPRADERIPDLLATPAAVRWISAEPLLGPVDLRWIAEPDDDKDGVIDALLGCNWIDGMGRGVAFAPVRPGHEGQYMTRWVCSPEADILANRKIDWVVCGGESGPGARPMHPDWARSLRDQCAAAGVPYFFKQWGEWSPNPDPDNDDYAAVKARGARDTTFMQPDLFPMELVGKKRAGRLLDGVTHDAFPHRSGEAQ